jgi:hypothetical protein
MKSFIITEDIEITVETKELYKFEFPNCPAKITKMKELNPGEYKIREDGVIFDKSSNPTVSWQLKFKCLGLLLFFSLCLNGCQDKSFDGLVVKDEKTQKEYLLKHNMGDNYYIYPLDCN